MIRDTTPARLRFGAFEIDLRDGDLRQNGRRVPLQEQPFQVLRMLVECGGKVATREDIQNQLWPNNTIVEFDHSINTAIKKIRSALGDSAEDPTYIETVGRRGYRLMTPVEPVSSSDDVAPGGLDSSSDDGGAVLSELEAESLTGQTVSHYRVLEIVGGGGMGVVYRAEDIKLGRAVALKFLPEEVAKDPRTLERFEREARAASALDHPNLCSIYEFGEHEGKPFIVMQLLQGQTLREWLAGAQNESGGARALASGQLLDFAIQITNGLEAAHEKGIIHRDIKPANIFVTEKGVVKILDFGLAKLAAAGEEEGRAGEADSQGCLPPAARNGVDAAILSRPGMRLGTAAYMSPEQVRGESLDERTDLFSFGLVLYEMVTGQQAFRGSTAQDLHAAILNSEPTPAIEVKPDLPTKLAAIIHKCLQKNRKLRYQRAGDVRTDLEQVKREGEHPSHRRWAAITAGAIVVAALVAGGFYWRLRKASPLTEKDTIVLAEFANTTGDAVFDGTLRQGLSSQLEQSPFLNLLSDQRVAETLALMSQPKDARLTGEVAREVCQRTASAATIEGSIATLGSQYVLGLRAVNCRDGDLLAEEQVAANSKEQVLNALGKAAAKLRAKLGEKLASVQRYDVPLEQATTPSLEALQAYTRARSVQMTGQADPIPYFKRSLELDQNFAAAYASLATQYENHGQIALASSNYRRAYELRNRVSQRERLSIEGHYYDAVTGELEKAVESYKELSLNDPRDQRPHQNLSVLYEDIGRYDKAVEEALETIRIAPDNVGPYAVLILSYNAMNQPEKAKAAFEQAQVRKLDDPSLLQYRYCTAFLLKDDAFMANAVAQAMGKARAEDLLLSTQSETEAYRGQLKKARELSQRAMESAKHADAPEIAALWRANEALRDAEVGDSARSLRAASEAMALMPARDVKVVTALSLARAGKPTQAQKMVEDLDREFPLDTLMQNYSLPTVRAAIALGKNNPAEAIEALTLTVPYELGGRSFGYLYPAYLRGEAYLKAGQSRQAVSEFQKVIDHPGIMLNFVTGALAHLQLARARAMMGDNMAARQSYQDFLTLWKDADPDIPIFKQAKAEYAKLP